MIFSKRNKKIDPNRRFGSREFRTKLRNAGRNRRVLISARRGALGRVLGSINPSWKSWRLLIVIGFVILFYYLAVSQYFLVTDISISGNNEVDEERVRQIIEQ